MKKSSLTKIYIALFVIIAGAIGLRNEMKGRLADKKTAAASPRAAVAASGSPATAVPVDAKTAAIPPASAAPPLPNAKASLAPALAPQLETELPTFAFDQELSTFAELQKKVFMSDDEKLARARILSNPTLLQELASLLRVPAAVGSDAERRQAQAIDLLMEALDAPEKQTAADVLRDVVRDGTIEGNETPVKHALAGVKAEVMYRWSSKDPTQKTVFEALLPGPVSRRIWQNVQEAQAQNRAESMREAGI